MKGWKIKICDTTYHIAYRVYDERKGSIEGIVRILEVSKNEAGLGF